MIINIKLFHYTSSGLQTQPDQQFTILKYEKPNLVMTFTSGSTYITWPPCHFYVKSNPPPPPQVEAPRPYKTIAK